MDSPEEISERLDRARESIGHNVSAEDNGDLPPITTLSIDVVGTRKKRWKGDFTFKVPNLGDNIKIGAMKSAYLPLGGGSDPQAAALAEQICYLQVTLTKTPDWWEPAKFYDATPVTALYGEATRYESRFHGEDTKPRADTEVSEGVGEPDGGGSADVGRKIQPPAKRSETLTAHDA